jgi:2-phospho-L-lactate/phosphoenolpyruvate guanylyltransferase
MAAHSTWWVIVPMKDMTRAKTRLAESRGQRRQFAIVMARDTLCAVVNADAVEGVLVVCEREEDVESFALPGVSVVVRPGLDINDAIRAGVALVRFGGDSRNVAALPGDLPYLSSSELDVVLERAASVPRAVVGDRTGRGTTLLTARTGVELEPRYGPGSLAQHLDTGATQLSVPAWSGIRRDVDLQSDLAPTPALGRRTSALLDQKLTKSWVFAS